MYLFIQPLLFGLIFVFHKLLFPKKNYALSKNDYCILVIRDLLFTFQMLLIFILFYSKFAFCVTILMFFQVLKNLGYLFVSKEEPYLILVAPSNRKKLALNGVKLEFLLEYDEKLDLELFKKAISFERFDAIILNNISKINVEIIKNVFGKKIKIFNYT